MNIRNSVKAIIIKDGKILAMKAKDKNGIYYLLPGGGQHHGETVFEALKRECLEEIGCHIEIGRLQLIREYIGMHHEFPDEDKNIHQMEYMFSCRILNNETPQMGTEPDNNQIGTEWLDIKAIQTYRLYPRNLRTIIVSKKNTEQIYYGDIN